jgi:cell division protein FtsN
MTTPNNSNQTDFENSINARPINESEQSYRDGYYQGRAIENRLQTETRTSQSNGTSTGLFLGFLLAILAGLGVAAFFIFNNSNAPVLSPNDSTSTEIEEPNNPERETTIIERTIEKTQEVIPVPQAQPNNPTPAQSESQPVENSINIPIIQEPEKSNQEQTEPTKNQVESPEQDNQSNLELDQNQTEPESTP